MHYILLTILLTIILLPFFAYANPSLPGGEGSVNFKPFPSYLLPVTNLPEDKKKYFHAGRALAHQPWVKAPSATTSRDGLGPVYNARMCLACHANGGRGLMPNDSKTRLVQGLVRISIPGKNKYKGVVLEPTYGDQIQTQSTALAHQLGEHRASYRPTDVRPEAYIYITWNKIPFVYPDGKTLELRKPEIRLENIGYGKFHPETMFSLRNAPPIHGVGLLEMIDVRDLIANADAQKKHGLVSGKINWVWDPVSKSLVIGRFGLKANKPSVLVQTAAAFQGDVGITSSIFPDESCTQVQKNCNNQVSGETQTTEEINDVLLNMVGDFAMNLGVPKARKVINEHQRQRLAIGKSLFASTGCIACHRPSYTTKDSERFPHLGNQVIWPYTDLLLHDMGEGLADHRPDFLASGSEWKTPALWGIGLNYRVNGAANLMHDGRAKNVEEAILWHGGEAKFSQQQFIHLPTEKRENLIEFVNSL